MTGNSDCHRVPSAKNAIPSLSSMPKAPHFFSLARAHTNTRAHTIHNNRPHVQRRTCCSTAAAPLTSTSSSPHAIMLPAPGALPAHAGLRGGGEGGGGRRVGVVGVVGDCPVCRNACHRKIGTQQRGQTSLTLSLSLSYRRPTPPSNSRTRHPPLSLSLTLARG